jgi:tetratricopeptide (TPR) repeat protein
VLVEYGNIAVREGNLEQAFYNFGKALDLTEKHQLEEERFGALNVVGWIYRLLGDVEQAINYYIQALDYAAEKGAEVADASVLARLHNNLGYVYALERDRDSARRMCHHALTLWKQVRYQRGESVVHSTLGRIYIEFDEYDTAIEEFELALEIINPQDEEWLSKIYLGRAQAFRLRSYQAELNAQALSEGIQRLDDSEEIKRKHKRSLYYRKSQTDLNASKKDLIKARQFNIFRDKPEYYYRFAIIHLSEKNDEDAKKCFEKGYNLSKEIYDLHYQLMNLNGLAKICSRQRDVSQIQRFRNEVDTFSNTSQTSIFNYFKKEVRLFENNTGNLKQQINQHPLPIALLKRYLGDMALYENKLDEALNLYKETFPILAKYGRHEPLTITGQLKDIQYFVFPHLEKNIIQALARELQLFWRITIKDEPLKRRYPEALLTFGRWQSGEYSLWDTNLEEQVDE